MHVYKVKAFARFQRGQRLSDSALSDAVRRAAAGLVDADLGGGLIKQRIARQGQGKRGGYRTILAYRQGQRAVFLYGFAKSEQDNIDDEERIALRAFGQYWLSLNDADILVATLDGKLMEVTYEGDDSS